MTREECGDTQRKNTARPLSPLSLKKPELELEGGKVAVVLETTANDNYNTQQRMNSSHSHHPWPLVFC